MFRCLDFSNCESSGIHFAMKRGMIPLRNVTCTIWTGSGITAGELTFIAENSNTLTSVDLRNCWNIDGEKATSLLSSCVNLTSLRVDGSNINMDSMCMAVPKFTSLKYFSFDGRKCGHPSESEVQEVDFNNRYFLRNITQFWKGITEICIKSQSINTQSAEMLFQIPSLVKIDLQKNDLVHSESMWVELIANKSIREVNLSRNKIGDDAVCYITNKSNITHLNVSYCDIGDPSIFCILLNNKITHLDVSGNNKITDNAWYVDVPQNRSLVHLNVSNNKKLSEAALLNMSYSSNLKHLNISGNKLMINQKSIIAVLNQTKQLREFVAQHCSINSLHLSVPVATNSGIHTFCLGFNDITTIPDLILNLPNLTKLDLQSNDLHNEDVGKLFSKTSLKDLNLSYNLFLVRFMLKRASRK
ncbi:PIRL3 [Acrasis kona]|uniref:PIRL3 n=1 Tax=Acrasis kona TaxID=1008807 RepID=A0AAW2ZDA5_9EUKA